MSAAPKGWSNEYIKDKCGWSVNDEMNYLDIF
jgi:hypothetical protein